MLLEGIRALSEALMETEVAGLIDAARHERSGVPLRDAHADVEHADGHDRARSQGPAGHLLFVLHHRTPLAAPTDAKVSTDTIVLRAPGRPSFAKPCSSPTIRPSSPLPRGLD